ncbi:MAG: hypothetical protein ACJA2P_001630 [Rhodoferax sp.]|jgi:hypothetical protein
MANMPPRFSLMATDLTEQKRIATLADSERLAQALLATAQQSRQALLRVIEDQKQAQEIIESDVAEAASESRVGKPPQQPGSGSRPAHTGADTGAPAGRCGEPGQKCFPEQHEL